MARGGKRRGGGGGGRGGGGEGGGRGPRKTGIEKYGQDEVDEFLGLDDDVLSEGERSRDVIQEEDVLTLKSGSEEKAKGKKAKKAKQKKQEEEEEKLAEDEEPEDEEAAEERGGAISKGWRREDFYGGDTMGADSDEDSDEDLVLEEARKLEELRARRLKGEDDPLAALLGRAEPEAKEEGAKEESAAAAGAGAGASAQFEALFDAEAERGAPKRDLAQLPEAKRRGLLKSEAPELVPLLMDFRSKLQGLREMLPLLAPQAHEYMKPSGVSYLKAKATLLLNTLANLSYYILIRSEGGAVRSHPVISQLVWLRELHGQLGQLDERLAPAVAKALKDWKKLKKKGLLDEAMPSKAEAPAPGPAKQETPPPPAKKLSLRERFRLLHPEEKEKPAEEAKPAAKPQRKAGLSTSDLLRLPGKRGKEGGAADAPSDLAESDPLVGGWNPQSTLAEQILSVKQQLGARAAKEKTVSADLNVEAVPLKPRQRMRESQAEVDEVEKATAGRGEKPDEEDEEEDELVASAKAQAAARKARKEAALEARKQAILAQQFKPEEVLDGRRATSKKILQNRGLVRQRKRSSGNARVNNRQKYEKAVKRRRGAVQDMREGATDGTYEGEATGVRTHLKKSQKLS